MKNQRKGKNVKTFILEYNKDQIKEFVSCRLSEKPTDLYHLKPGLPTHSSLKQIHAEIPFLNNFINMAVGFNTKSTKNYNKASNSIVMLAPPHGLELAQVTVKGVKGQRSK